MSKEYFFILFLNCSLYLLTTKTVTKTQKGVFTDNKVPVMERDTVPIVTMNGQPVWIVGFRLDDRIRVSEKTTNLLIIKFEAIK